jgi:hypothetical protein
MKSHNIPRLELILDKIEVGDSKRKIVRIHFGCPMKKTKLCWGFSWGGHGRTWAPWMEAMASLLIVGWVPIFWEVRGKSIGGDLNVDDEGSEQRRFEPVQSLHHGSIGYQPVHTWIGSMSLQANREHKQE